MYFWAHAGLGSGGSGVNHENCTVLRQAFNLEPPEKESAPQLFTLQEKVQ